MSEDTQVLVDKEEYEYLQKVERLTQAYFSTRWPEPEVVDELMDVLLG